MASPASAASASIKVSGSAKYNTDGQVTVRPFEMSETSAG